MHQVRGDRHKRLRRFGEAFFWERGVIVRRAIDRRESAKRAIAISDRLGARPQRSAGCFDELFDQRDEGLGGIFLGEVAGARNGNERGIRPVDPEHGLDNGRNDGDVFRTGEGRGGFALQGVEGSRSGLVRVAVVVGLLFQQIEWELPSALHSAAVGKGAE